MRAIAEEGYTTPTPIQAQAIPPVLAGKDLLGIAQTGTGKTAAFALPILDRLSQSGHARQPRCPRTLILAPTRELAIQVQESFVNYGRHLPLRSTCIFGGVGDAPQKQAMQRGVDILVATPGRLLDLMGQGFINLRQLEIFVLDEADRMLDMGFIHDVRKVVAQLPPRRQTLFFSATMPTEISQLASNLLRQPVRVEVTPASTPIERIEQCLYFIGKRSKPHLLRHLLENPDLSRVLVFTRTKHGANKVAENLERSGFSAAAIHGNKSQTRRQEALQGFKEGSIRVLVATDIAARGIDVDGVSHVVNFDLPHEPETFVHRIGRTARAGASGQAIAFCASDERDDLKQIQKLIRMEIPVLRVPDEVEDLADEAAATSPQQGNHRRPAPQGRNNRNRRPANTTGAQSNQTGRPAKAPQNRAPQSGNSAVSQRPLQKQRRKNRQGSQGNNRTGSSNNGRSEQSAPLQTNSGNASLGGRIAKGIAGFFGKR